MALSEARTNMGFLSSSEVQTEALEREAIGLRNDFYAMVQPEIAREPAIIDEDTFTIVLPADRIMRVHAPIDPKSPIPADFRWEETSENPQVREQESHTLEVSRQGKFRHMVTVVSRQVLDHKLGVFVSDLRLNRNSKPAKVDMNLLSGKRSELRAGRLQPIAQEIR